VNAMWKSIQTPLDGETVAGLRAGERVLITGIVYTARDRAHARISEMVQRGESLPIDLKGSILYYTGPSPAPSGGVVGAAGPTTSSRMDPFTEVMLDLGVRGMIGKGRRGREAKELMRARNAVYFAAFGGAGAYYALRVVESSVAAFGDLGPEAIYRLRVKDFPVIVINDIHGGDFYEDVLRKRS